MKTIEVSDETYEMIKDKLSKSEQVDLSVYSDMVGKKFFFRTVTYHMVGRVKRLFGHFLELEVAAWVADSGRFMQAIKDGTLNEVEPVGQAWVNADSIVDFFPWAHELPRAQN